MRWMEKSRECWRDGEVSRREGEISKTRARDFFGSGYVEYNSLNRLFTSTTGQFAGAHGRHRCTTRVFPRAGIRHSHAQPPGRISSSSDGLLIHGRASRYLHRLPQSACTSRSLPLHFIPHTRYAASIPRSGDLPASVPTMHDPRHDTHQNVFRRIPACTDSGCVTSLVGKGTPSISPFLPSN